MPGVGYVAHNNIKIQFVSPYPASYCLQAPETGFYCAPGIWWKTQKRLDTFSKLMVLQSKSSDDFTKWFPVDVKYGGQHKAVWNTKGRNVQWLCPNTTFWDLSEKNDWNHCRMAWSNSMSHRLSRRTSRLMVLTVTERTKMIDRDIFPLSISLVRLSIWEPRTVSIPKQSLKID